MSASRDLLDALTAPGYVAMVSGRPGVGKTTLALMACARHGRCTYISYADPARVIESKMKAVSPGFSGSLKVLNALSGRPEEALSAIAEACERGELVVVDSVDAMLAEVREGLRPLLQMVYGSVKEKSGTLLLISEGASPAAQQLMYIADALVEMDFEEVLGQQVRAVRLLKDRERSISHPIHYMTFSPASLIEPYSTPLFPPAERFRELVVPPDFALPPLLSEEAQLRLGPFILLGLDESVASSTARLFVEFFIARSLKQGLAVNWLIGPDEDEEEALKELRALAGGQVERLRVLKVDPARSGYRASRFFASMIKERGPGVIDYVNLMSEEDFAVKAPVEFERFVSMMLRDATEKRRLALVYGYEDLAAVKIEKKYAHAIRSMSVVNGFIFWRPVRPAGPLYAVKMDPGAGRIEFVEMM